jgi:ADP-ribosylglycohydrolase
MLVELAIGDAYGAGFEYAPEEMVQAKNDLSGYVQHPRHGTRPGCYTDDTQMSIAIAEALVSGQPWSRANLADRFVRVFKRDPREGYARGFYSFLQEVPDGEQFLARVHGDSDKSGAAMRAGPIGVLPDVKDVIKHCSLQAAITHNTEDGIRAAVTASLMTHYFIHRRGPKRQLVDFLEAHVPGDWRKPWRGKVGSKGVTSVRAAITAVMATHRMSHHLQTCIGFTGDLDTVASIALAAPACSEEVVQDLPEHPVSGLENGRFGRDFLRDLDTQLLALAQQAARNGDDDLTD